MQRAKSSASCVFLLRRAVNSQLVLVLAQKPKNSLQNLPANPASRALFHRYADCDAGIFTLVFGDFVRRQMRGRCQFMEPCKQTIQNLPPLR
jgi:hypothetical protein